MAPGRLGKYQLIERIAQGGMGELYRARAFGPGGFEREVALKVIRQDVAADAHFVQMFVAEAKIASRLSHANLVHVYEFGQEDGCYFLSMELVEGRDLGKILRRCKEQRTPLQSRFALRIVEQVALGLDYAHRLNLNGESLQIVHRDVTPQNVLVSFDGVVQLTDFGIARMRHSEQLTQAGVIKGKFGYLSPEQASLGTVDARSDLFSLGIVLWEALTGARLFAGDNHADVLKQVLDKAIPPPSALNEEVPAALDRVVLRALEREPARRYSSGRALAGAIRNCVGAQRGVASETELARELRRLFPDQVPSQALDLRGESSVSRSLTPPQAQDTTLSAEILPQTTSVSVDLSLSTSTTAPQFAVASPVPRKRLRWATVGLSIAVIVALGLWVPKLRPADAPSPTPIPSPTANNFFPLILSPGPGVAGPGSRSTTPTPTPTPTATPTATATATPIDPGALRQAQGDRNWLESPNKESTAHAEGNTAHPEPVEGRAAVELVAAPKPKVTPTRSMHHHRYGHFSFVAMKPWAEVTIDRVSQGFTPIRDLRIAAGEHLVVLSNSEASIRRVFRVSLGESEEVEFRGDLRALQPVVFRGDLRSLQPRSEQ